MKKRTRRDFIRISTMGAGGMAVASPVLGMALKQGGIPDPEDLTGFTRIPTYCEVCFWKCAGWAWVNKEGELWKVEGNGKDPLCNGRLCPRGTGGIGMYYDSDRLKTPLIRTEERGKQVFREASWNQAMDYIAKKMKKIAAESGPESIAMFNHGSGGKHFSKLLKAFGTANFAAPSYAQCRGPREVGFETTFGTAINSPEPTDIKNTRCLVLIGSHIGENMHNGQIQEMSDAIDNGATIITVDPRYSTAASHSKYWLPIKPATDIALLLAWINVIIEEGLYDKEYVEKYAFGFEDLKAHVADKTPEWAAGITRLDPEQIRRTAQEMGNEAPATLVHPGRHVTWYGDDVQRTRAIAILNALLGSWGRKGGFFLPAKASAPGFPHPPYPKPKWDWKDTLNGRYPLARLSVANALIDASHPDNETDKKITGWFIVGTNLISTVPDTKRTLEALNHQELVVVVDTMPSEIAGYADVVLPECTYLERHDDLRLSPGREPSIAVRVPAVKPKYLTKPASWMVRRLAPKLKLQAHFQYDDYSEVLDWQLKALGLSLNRMKREGVKVYPRPESSMYLPEDGHYEFKTATGMIELYSLAMEDEGFAPLPDYTPHPDPPQGYYRLNYGRAPMHTFTRTNNNPNLTDLMPENKLWVNPKVASEWDLKNGQEVWLKNQAGVISSFPIKVRVTERIGMDNVYMVHGFGMINKKLTRAFGKGANDTQLMSNVMIDPTMGGTGMRGNFVTFITEDPNAGESPRRKKDTANEDMHSKAGDPGKEVAS